MRYWTLLSLEASLSLEAQREDVNRVTTES